MTVFADNIQSGLQALTSPLSSRSPVVLERTFRFNGGSQTQNFVLPANTENMSSRVYIFSNGSAATTDKITVSAAGINFFAFSSMGSATGILSATTVGLGTVTPVVSALVNPTAGTEVTAAVTLLSVDTAAQYQVVVNYNIRRAGSLGNT